MPSYRAPRALGAGYMHLHFGSGKNARNAPPQCRAKLPSGSTCCGMSQFECDWPGCDIPICADCATEVGPNRHLCPKHRQQPGLDIGEGAGEEQLRLL